MNAPSAFLLYYWDMWHSPHLLGMRQAASHQEQNNLGRVCYIIDIAHSRLIDLLYYLLYNIYNRKCCLLYIKIYILHYIYYIIKLANNQIKSGNPLMSSHIIEYKISLACFRIKNLNYNYVQYLELVFSLLLYLSTLAHLF